MWTGNTETRATVTYQGIDGTMDIVVDDMNDAAETLNSIKALVTDDFHNLGGADANTEYTGTANEITLTGNVFSLHPDNAMDSEIPTTPGEVGAEPADATIIKAAEYTTNGGIIVGTGAGTYAEESGETLRTSIGVDPAGTDNSDDNATNTQYSELVSFPGFTSLLADYSFTDNSANWDMAYGWGDHGAAGYTSFTWDFDYTDITNPPTIPAGNQIIDWTGASAGTIHATNYVDNNTTYTAGAGLSLIGTELACTITDTDTTYTAGTGLDLTGGVFSNTQTSFPGFGTITTDYTFTLDNIPDGTTYKLVTAAEKTVLGNTSNTNSGDNATNTQYSSLETNATHTGDVTGSGVLDITESVLEVGGSDTIFPADPNADKYLMWDDSVGDFSFEDAGSGGGYTNLTSFVAQTAWRLFYSNTDGDVTELALGTDGQVLTSTGASGAPAFEDASGGGSSSRVVSIKLTPDTGDALTTGNGKFIYFVPAILNGMNLVSISAGVSTVSSSGIPTFQIHNLTDTQDMLSTALTVDASEYHSSTATAAVIDTDYDDVATGDRIRIDCDTAGTGTKGVQIDMVFE
jgi:hypothetical protein